MDWVQGVIARAEEAASLRVRLDIGEVTDIFLCVEDFLQSYLAHIAAELSTAENPLAFARHRIIHHPRMKEKSPRAGGCFEWKADMAVPLGVGLTLRDRTGLSFFDEDMLPCILEYLDDEDVHFLGESRFSAADHEEGLRAVPAFQSAGFIGEGLKHRAEQARYCRLAVMKNKRWLVSYFSH